MAGMQENTEIKDHPGVARIKQMWDNGDFETIEKMVSFWEALENLGRIGDLIRRFILWCGVIAGTYFVISNYLYEWIKGIK